VQRVAVVGSGGAGKSTFARELGRRTGLAVIHLDRHHWKPGWVETPTDEWRLVQGKLTAGESWIIDGNYGGTFDVRFRRADTVIVLALSRWRCMFRVLRRVMRHRGSEVQAAGCPERLDFTFLRWVWRYPLDSRPRLDAAVADCRNHVRVIELRSPQEVRAFLSSTGASVAGA
jgi:adenylate kinase family enzyme